MSISTYSELKTAISNWMAKSNLSSDDEDFIMLAEARINTELDVMDMQATTDLTIDGQRITAPIDEIRAIRIYIDGTPKKPLDFVAPEYLYGTYGASSSGKPAMFTKEGGEYVFAPSPDTTYTGKLLYVQKVPALSDSNTTNWLLTAHPELYLTASMLEACLFVKDIEKAALYEARFNRLVENLKQQSNRRAYSGSTLVMRAQ